MPTARARRSSTVTIQSREGAEAATLVGSGKVDELARQVKSLDVDLVIFDHDLTPTQQRNLENALDCKVIDRTQLILDIFARRAGPVKASCRSNSRS